MTRASTVAAATSLILIAAACILLSGDARGFGINPSTACAVLLLLIVLILLKRVIHERRITAFKQVYTSLSKRRFMYSDEMRRTYPMSEAGKAAEGDPELSGKYLLAEPGWIAVVDIRDVTVTEVPAPKRTRGSAYARMRASLVPDFMSPYIANMKTHLGKTPFAGEVIAYLGSSWEDGRLRIDAYHSDFYDYQNHIGLRELYATKVIESMYARGGTDDGKLVSLWNMVDARDFSNRPAVIGACSLLLFLGVRCPDGERDFLFVHRRSGNVTDAMNTISMVPAGGLTWDESDPSHSCNQAFRSTILREFEEEVLGRSEVDCTERFDIPAAYDDPCVGIYFIGMGLDPLNIKIEAMAAMVIDGRRDCSALRAHLSEMTGLRLDGDSFSREDLDLLAKKASSEGSIRVTELTRTNVERLMLNQNSMPVFREAMRQLMRGGEGTLRGAIGLELRDRSIMSSAALKASPSSLSLTLFLEFRRAGRFTSPTAIDSTA
jgi:hypothetical protein